jgi:FeoB-associated Cys-rich membrane protein
MLLQEILVALLFVLVVFFLARRMHKGMQAKSCASGCGKCSSIDFSKIDTSKFESKS